MLTRLISLAIIVSAGISLSGCMTNTLESVPLGNITVGNQPLTAELIHHQDEVVKPRCKLYAKETSPKSWEMAGSYAINHAQAGLVGGGGGYALETKIVGAVMNPTNILAVGGATAVSAGAQAYASGWEQADAYRYSAKRGCFHDDAVGVHDIPPSEAKRVLKGGEARSYGPESTAQARQRATDQN